MNIYKRLAVLILLFLFIAPQVLQSQEKKPKVALVLSGGGAKGVAHIPVLQALDSLGIVPDLVVGNSMGSIVGALYAVGYSGNRIANIAKQANWNELIGGGTALSKVSVEEKSEFSRYLVELNWADGKLKPGSFLVNDQNLRGFIASLTFPVYNVDDFDDLSIPFRAIATDIVNGKEVVLDRGSLSLAMRASMSIPGIFRAVPYEDTLLVDGGLLNNFPVDVAKDLGADIIIGSDVGSGMVSKEKLNNFASLLFQAGMINSNLKHPENRALCDILIEHTPNLTYSTGDFTKADAIYEQGKKAVQQNLDTLAALSRQLKKFKQRTHQLPDAPNEFVLDTVIYKGMSKTNLALVKARTAIFPNKAYTPEDVLDGVNRAMGTTIFNHITYTPILFEDNRLGIEIKGFERSKHQVKGSLHYDGDYGVGLILNYTGRNIIGNASRTLATIDISEQPKLRVQHQKNFGLDRNWWWRSEAFVQQLRQKVFVGGKYVDDFKYRYHAFDFQINRNLSSLRSYVGFGLKHHNTNFKPTTDPDINDNIFKIRKYSNNNTELYAQYHYNSTNAVFFPIRGTILKSYLGRSLRNDVRMSASDNTFPNLNGSTNNFIRFGIDYQKNIPLSQRTTAIFGASGYFIFEDTLRNNDISFSDYGLNSKYFLGGNLHNPRMESFVFPGLKQGELGVNQFLKLNLGVQIHALNRVYIKPHVNVASVGFDSFSDFAKNAFTAKGKWTNSTETSFLLSAGSTFSYNSLLGPIDFDLSWVNNADKVRFFIGIGVHFNRSN
ncbi:patatin [Oceanihabitans sp. IOP_32]|uniref:patatin-like phospholipase family protein n=1 Tax=Oceanihabitans sp. IOP_32 TaxID=2529032 RepID=UPI001293CCC1|nr:patatin-like phospholipase family protein [Oceanihabitans sp. IOP_32]QFZ54134.1 patatin [Oceanihabitans sp. IOP_32]